MDNLSHRIVLSEFALVGARIRHLSQCVTEILGVGRREEEQEGNARDTWLSTYRRGRVFSCMSANAF